MKFLTILSLVVSAVVAVPHGYYSVAPTTYVKKEAQPAYFSKTETFHAPAPAATYVAKPKTYEYASPAISYAYPAPKYEIISSQYHAQDELGQYSFGYSSSDGQNKEESKLHDGSVSGKYSYTSPEGQLVNLKYNAGKGGFYAEGDHLPVAPAVPEQPEFLRLAYKEAEERLAKAYLEAERNGDLYEEYEENKWRPMKVAHATSWVREAELPLKHITKPTSHFSTYMSVADHPAPAPQVRKLWPASYATHTGKSGY